MTPDNIKEFFGTIFILGGFASIVFSVYYFLRMIEGAKNKRSIILHLIAPIAIFIPQLWTEQGNHNRIKMLAFISIFMICFVAAAIIVDL